MPRLGHGGGGARPQFAKTRPQAWTWGPLSATTLSLRTHPSRAVSCAVHLCGRCVCEAYEQMDVYVCGGGDMSCWSTTRSGLDGRRVAQHRASYCQIVSPALSTASCTGVPERPNRLGLYRQYLREGNSVSPPMQFTQSCVSFSGLTCASIGQEWNVQRRQLAANSGMEYIGPLTLLRPIPYAAGTALSL